MGGTDRFSAEDFGARRPLPHCGIADEGPTIWRSMAERVKCFVAYPSEPAARAETIESAIEQISGGSIVDIEGWRNISAGGRVVVSAVCERIQACQLFVADVTSLNPNVLFELGYAIAKNKRVWLLFDPNIERAKQQFDNFQLLSTIVYAPFSNSHDIVREFYKDEPYNDLDKTVLQDLLGSPDPRQRRRLLLLKPSIDTEAAIRISRMVASGPLPSMIDDPREVKSQPLSWYVQHVDSSLGVVCQLLSTDYRNWELQNAKQALVAGFAYGRGVPMLMLAQSPYASPVDYRDILRQHATAANAEAIYSDWLLPVIDSYHGRVRAEEEYEFEERARGALRDIAIGEPIAEFESDEVPDCFVPTAAYNEALRSKHSIFVGRKGTGKTASLYKLSEDLRADPRNHVCIVKPIDYELAGLLALLGQQLAVSEKGYLIESFWKFLIFTELAKSTYDQILGKPAYYVRTAEEERLCAFVEANRSLIVPEFSARLESAVRQVGVLQGEVVPELQKAAISERLHTEMLSELRVVLGGALHEKAKVSILVDNLDKSWERESDLGRLSDLLFGLLGVSSRISQEFARERRGSVNLALTLFLRSDIYSAMVEFARERDKLPVRRIDWQDPGLLRRVIEQRFIRSGADIVRPEEVWERYFPETVRNVSIRDYLAWTVLPRPRDLIVMVKAALEFAVNRGHSRIDESDLLSAEKQYSQFALNSLITEGAPRIPEIEYLFLEFAGGPAVIDCEQMTAAMRKAGISETRIDELTDLLVELTFLGPQTTAGHFEFVYDEESLTKARVMARNFAESNGGARRYQINPAFHAYLEIARDGRPSMGQLPMGLV